MSYCIREKQVSLRSLTDIVYGWGSRDSNRRSVAAFSRDKKKKQQHLRTSPFRLKASVHSLHSSLSSAGNLKQAVSPDVCYDLGARESWTKDWQDERRRWKRIDMCKRWVLASRIDVKAAEKTDVASPKAGKHTWKPTIVNLMPKFASVCTTWWWCGPPSLDACGQRRTIATVLPERNS